MTNRRISRLLIANRGEIACRSIRTAHAMGIEVVAICCPDDRASPHVAKADIAATVDSYLDSSGIIAIAKRFDVDAIHPGYGYLAENAQFAAAVIDNGLLFIGPSAKTIALLGSKRRAGSLAQAAGIPMIPRFAFDGNDSGGNGDETLPIFPLMIKPSAGGGGKGMTIVRNPDQLKGAIDSAKRLAKAAFGCEELIIERYIESGRHIEVQILADQLGNVIHLGERECSIQRRHQKVIEEAPAANLSSGLREEICAAAVRLTHAVDYQSAGTVEFIVADDGSFYFLEVNTRLQVEHAVTEMTTSIDIVGEQIRIAEGHPLSIAQSEVEISGAAIETRIYAENPNAGDLPTTGTIQYLDLSSTAEPSHKGQPNLRIDCGITVGQRIGINYDPMLLKVIAHGRDREQARARLVMGLTNIELAGVTTNKNALVAALKTTAFRRGELDTSFWERHREALTASTTDILWAAAAAIYTSNKNKRKHTAMEHLAPGFRLNGWAPQVSRISAHPAPLIEVSFCWIAQGQYDLTVHRVDQESETASETATTNSALMDSETVDREAEAHREPSIGGTVHVIENADHPSLELWDASGRRHRFTVRGSIVDDAPQTVTEHPSNLIKEQGSRLFVHGEGADFVFTLIPRFAVSSQAKRGGACVAPMPGRVAAVHVELGDRVTEGQVIVVLEAMKMEHPILAPHSGSIAALSVTVGDQVDSDHIVAVIALGQRN